jgi:hybrid cluster-associated redox disulfide protein
MNTPLSHLDLLVAEALNRYPDLVHVFMRYRTGCVGCLMASFCTLRSAVKMHGLQDTEFLKEVEKILCKNPIDTVTDTRSDTGETYGPA